MHTLDPKVEPRRSDSPRQKDAGGLVFLDVGGSPARPRPKIAGLEQTSRVPEPPARPRARTPQHVQPLPEFELLPDIDTLTPIAPMEGLELQADLSVADVEPAFDLSISDVDVKPLEGLESVADPDNFVLDPDANSGPDTPTSPLEGLIPAMQDHGLGEPLETGDPLAGLNVIEDERFYANDEGALDTPEVTAAKNAPVPPAPVEEDIPDIEIPDIEPLDLEIEADAAVEEVQEEEEEEEAEAPPPPKPSKPKLVEPLRMTRPKPKVEKQKEKEPEAAAGKAPINPFQRPRPKPKSGSPKASPRVGTPPGEIPRGATPKGGTPQRGDDNFVDLADWLREDSGKRSTRMIAKEDENREEGEQADFTDMLEKFKAGVAANVDDEDFDSHYDLGVAYREMGLIDEAIFEFQKALRGATQRIRAYEALGQCFIDRSDFEVAVTVLGRALREPGMEDEDLIGVLYLLGFASEGSRKPRDAAAYYQRVFAIDTDFRDVNQRLKQMTKAASK
jgi:tetratricopeptide (TPR) repeat protein